MPIIGDGDRRGWSGRLAVGFIYLILIVGGASMAYPFLVTLTGSFCNAYDYDRRSPYPRFLVSRADRFMRVLCSYYPPTQRTAMRRLQGDFPSWDPEWLTWKHAGTDVKPATAWANRQLAVLDDPARAAATRAMATDYHDFMADFRLAECVLAFDARHLCPFLRDRYRTMAAFNDAWEMSLDDFIDVTPPIVWLHEPLQQQSYLPTVDTRYRDLLAFRQAYRDDRFEPYLRDDPTAMTKLRPATIAWTWELFLGRELGIADRDRLHTFPFPVPAAAAPELRALWLAYLPEYFPARHVRIPVTTERQAEFRAFLVDRFRNLKYLNEIMAATDTEWQTVASWDDLPLTPTVPDSHSFGKAWINYVIGRVPVDQWEIRDTLPEQAFQKFVLARHGSLAAVNAAYNLHLTSIEQLRIPCREAFLVTFAKHQWSFTRHQFTRNYALVFDYLVLRGRAAVNTVILVILSLLIAITVNPLAGYALSRFQLPQTEKVLIFCLATMAFPASVSAIPGFLLLRDLGLLNTFAALVLPGAANGMAIFLLKGFFDSLPKELYEAATIDGAPEWQIFFRISLPLVKPILAVNLLNAFIAAYNGWAWAIIVCQDQKMWTIAVWTYQFSQQFASQPFAVMAAYMVSSLPVFLVFLLCQKIIMRGIILPQMK